MLPPLRPYTFALFVVAFAVAMSTRGGASDGDERLGTGCEAADFALGLPPKNYGVRSILPTPEEREQARIALENGGVPLGPARKGKSPRRGSRPAVVDVYPFDDEGIVNNKESTPPPPVRHDNAGPLRPFVVVHADPLMAQTLVNLVDAHDYMAHEGAGPVWLYEEMYRWSPRHAEALWNFTCGRTRGRWPACGSAVHGGPDPYDRMTVDRRDQALEAAAAVPHTPTTLPASARPLAAGFPVDLNFLYPASDLEGVVKGRPASKGLEVHPDHEPLNVELLETLLKRKARVVILASKSLTRRLLREAVHGSVPLRGGRGVRGRRSGVSRALYGPAGYVNGLAPGAPHRDHRHIHQLCGARDAPTRIVAMLRHYSDERKALLALGDRLIRRYGLVVNILDEDELLEDPRGGGVYSFYAYALGDGEPSEVGRHPFDGGGVDAKRHNHWAVPRALRARLEKYVRVSPAVLEDCADALERTRIRLAVDEAEDGPFLMADLDYVLAQIERHRASSATSSSIKVVSTNSVPEAVVATGDGRSKA